MGGIINNDNNKREAYTQQFVQQASKQFPNCNFVICHTQHKVAGPQVVHQHHELGMTVGTCGYDSYCSPMGQPFIFENQGDGGYLNWAYAGEFSRATLSYCSVRAWERVRCSFQAKLSSRSSPARTGRCRFFLFAGGLAKRAL